MILHKRRCQGQPYCFVMISYRVILLFFRPCTWWLPIIPFLSRTLSIQDLAACLNKDSSGFLLQTICNKETEALSKCIAFAFALLFFFNSVIQFYDIWITVNAAWKSKWITPLWIVLLDHKLLNIAFHSQQNWNCFDW